MTLKSRIVCAMAASWALSAFLSPVAATEGSAAQQVLFADFGGATASADVRYTAARILASSDNQGWPFVIVDKKDARIFVFQADGQLVGASAALLGLASGDHSVPGIGSREPSKILPFERTTPSGRFLSQPGRNLDGEEVVWINYTEGLAIHRVRPGQSQERRLQRLASSTPDDNRVSLGCVVVPVAFFEEVVQPVLGKNYSVVYVLPETRAAHALFAQRP
ncbi:MAG TPA: hypothetical protein VE934_06445 [Polaromonas sp.]|uniref:hypothetical protein n=1 Tax=Polaromonas sp. TaxID=1869339 RepID=UPI002D2D2B82|nr:hypothetical protein [Polaromonas sp.]HYW56578.1 hypothetical protein [Polaromonas sp.]